MALIALPDSPLKWQSATWGPVGADGVNEFLQGATQVTSFAKRLWTARIVLPPLSDDQKRVWRSRLAQLSDLSNRCEMGPPDYQAGPSTGYAGPAPQVAGGGQLGLSLDVDGVTPSAALLGEGDYFQITADGVKQVLMMTADATANGAGEATLNFSPALRNAPLNNATVEIFSPKCQFMLATPQVQWELALGGFMNASLDFIEAFAP